MIYREQHHAPDTFPRCTGCNREPKHVTANGRHSREPIIIGAISQRHMIECARCGCRTQLHESLAHARAEWIAKHTPAALPLRIVPRRFLTA